MGLFLSPSELLLLLLLQRLSIDLFVQFVHSKTFFSLQELECMICPPQHHLPTLPPLQLLHLLERRSAGCVVVEGEVLQSVEFFFCSASCLMLSSNHRYGRTTEH